MEKKMTSTSTLYRPDIDGLRTLSVLAVLIYHAWPSMLPGGFVGVDIFFVISGFLITSIIFKDVDQNQFTLKNFYSRRFRRIFPALCIVLIFCLAVGWFGLFASEFQMLGKHVAAAALFVSNFILFRESGYFDPSAELKPLLHLWSLGIEEQFYIAWPLIVYFLAKKPALRLPLIVFLLLGSFGLNVWYIDIDASATFYFPFTRLWGLLSGSLLAYIMIYTPRYWLFLQRGLIAHVCAFLGLILVLSSFFVLNPQTLYPGWWAVLPTLGAVLLIVAGQRAFVNSYVLSLPGVVYIGLISYPLYLWHWPLLSFLHIFESGSPTPLMIAMAVGLSFILSWLTYEFVEKKLRHRKKIWVVPVLVAVVGILGVIGGGIFLYKGFPNREKNRISEDFAEQMKRQPDADSSCKEYLDGLGYKKPHPFYCRATGLHLDNWVAIIGDSHAHAVFPGFAEEFAKKGFGTLLLANSGCPPFLGTTTGNNEKERKDCAQNIETILTLVEQEARIGKVLITSRGPIYITGSGYGVAETSSKNEFIYTYNPAGVPEKKDTLRGFLVGLENTINRLKSPAREVFYLLENPELGVHPRNCVGKRPLTFSDRVIGCRVAKEHYRKRMSEYRSGILAAENIIALDPEPHFCNDEICHAIDEGKLLYADDDHLSVEGSRFLAARVIDGIF